MKCCCQHCEGHIEYPDEYAGQSVPCPHCGKETALAPSPRSIPVHEAVIRGEKLAERDIFVTLNGAQRKSSIDLLRTQFHAGLIAGDSSVLVTSCRWGETCYCGEGTVADVVSAWESAPMDDYDRQDATRMIQEFSFPDNAVWSKAQYHDLRRLYQRCNDYHRYVASRDKEFKRLSKAGVKDLVFQLDQADPHWDSTEGEKRFAEELCRRHPNVVRSENEKKAKKQKEKQARIKQEERRPLIETRNHLTRFPHKTMQIEVKDFGMISMREIKPKIRDGTMTPETLVRYRTGSEWVELWEFLNDWMQNKATSNQISYLKALQREHKVSADIPLDMSRQDASDRISALAPQRNHE